MCTMCRCIFEQDSGFPLLPRQVIHAPTPVLYVNRCKHDIDINPPISVLETHKKIIIPKMLKYSFKPFILCPLLNKVPFVPPFPRTSLFLLIRLGEPPPRGEGDVGDSLRHHRVLHLRPRTRHLWPRPALRHPWVTVMPTGSDKPCSKGGEQRGGTRGGEGRSEILYGGFTCNIGVL